jgi:(+)-trans-carveol dehydrogenase
MAGRVEGKVAFITGAAHGQGRSHAVRLAQEGADIIAIDVCKRVVETSPIPPATPEELAETADLVNAGIGNGGDTLDQCTEHDWQEMIDVNLSGVWKTVKAGVPHLIKGGNGGSIILTSSVGGLKAYPHCGNYVAAKHGVVGLMRSFAVELGQHNIRVNSVHPTHVSTGMIMNEGTWKLFRPDLENPGPDDMAPICQMFHTLPVPWVDAVDISNAVLFFASDEARYVTGVTLPVDAGSCLK